MKKNIKCSNTKNIFKQKCVIFPPIDKSKQNPHVKQINAQKQNIIPKINHPNIVMPKITPKLKPKPIIKNNSKPIQNIELNHIDKRNIYDIVPIPIPIPAQQPLSHKPIIKTKFECLDAEEYLEQFYKSPNANLVDFNELGKKLDLIKKILKNNNIFVVKTPWDSTWDNLTYSVDCAQEIILKHYPDILLEKFRTYAKSKRSITASNYPEKLLSLLYADKLISYLVISNYFYCMGKITRVLKIYCNFVNEKDKKYTLESLSDVFGCSRISYSHLTNILMIRLSI